MDALDLVTEEGEAVGLVVGEGENIDQGAADRVLAGRRDEIDLLETVVVEGFPDLLERDFHPFFQGEEGFADFLFRREVLRQGFGVGHDDGKVISGGEDPFDGGGALDAEGGLVVALFDSLAAGGKVEDLVPFNQVVQVRGAVFRRFLGRQDDAVETAAGGLGKEEPAGGKEEAAAVDVTLPGKPLFYFFRLKRTYQHRR